MTNLRRSNRLTHDKCDSNNNEKNERKPLVNTLDREPGYYQQIICPLLKSNTEKKLIEWLQSVGLLKISQNCSGESKISNGMCNGGMSLIRALDQDLCQWKCEWCSEKKSIRDDSIFNGITCGLKDAVRVILAWCNALHIDYVANTLGVNTSAIEELYVRAASVAEKCMKRDVNKWQIGGEGVVVVIDTYPEGCANTSLARTNRPILCISEIKSMPQKYWLEALDAYSPLDTNQVNSLKQRILCTVQTIVRPGSILVAPAISTLCSYNDLQELTKLYPTVVSVDDLARHNNERQNVYLNLQTIWKRVLDVCEEAQFHCSPYIDLFITSHMWRVVHRNEAFERLLYQISLMQ